MIGGDMDLVTWKSLKVDNVWVDRGFQCRKEE